MGSLAGTQRGSGALRICSDRDGLLRMPSAGHPLSQWGQAAARCRYGRLRGAIMQARAHAQRSPPELVELARPRAAWSGGQCTLCLACPRAAERPLIGL